MFFCNLRFVVQTEKEYRLNELNNKECKEVRCRESKEQEEKGRW